MDFYYLVKLNKYHSHFAVEFLLLMITVFTVGLNLFLRTNLRLMLPAEHSLFFVYLKDHASLNEQLVQAYESVDVKLAEINLPAVRQVLAASTKNRAESLGNSREILLPTMSGSALQKPNPASSGSPLPNHDVEVYQVRGGDTVARIAASYGVSVDTILVENKLTSVETIRPGQELRILPTTGIRHVVLDGETLEGIAKKYVVDVEDILEYNDIEIEDVVQPGDELIIPNAKVKVEPTPARKQYLANLKKPDDYQQVEVPNDYRGSNTELIWPLPEARRLSQKFSRRHPGIDIPCNNCPVVAAADGIVEIAGYQRNGYGNTIVINHGHDVRTRYGHAWQILVSAGEQVSQGQVIMLSGSTGRSSGPHLHFEVRVSGNTAVNPLSVVK